MDSNLLLTGLLWYVAFLFSTTCHEAAHAWAAHRGGDDTAYAGGQVTLVAPGGQVTPVGVVPRLKQLRVAGVIDTGHYEYDATLALLHIDDAERIFRLEGPNGIRVKLRDAQQAPAVAAELMPELGEDVMVRDWTRANRNWFTAVQIEKRMMFIILTLIIAVAAFNLVSTLVMTVTDKQAENILNFLATQKH